MSGVWIFDRRGVARLISHPTRESFEQKDNNNHNQHHSPGTATAPGARPRVLVYLPEEQVIRSYDQLEQRLGELGWTRYRGSDKKDGLVQFHRSDSCAHLISLPKSFSSIKPFHMYDIVVKNRSFFEVRDVPY
ncbi:Flowering-promoting factor 1-like protein 1 [Linum perenne]